MDWIRMELDEVMMHVAYLPPTLFLPLDDDRFDQTIVVAYRGTRLDSEC